MLKRKIFSLIMAVVLTMSLLPANFAPKKVEAAASANRVVGYFPSYRMSTVNSIDFSALTHCILSFMTYNNGTLTSGFGGGDVQNIVSKCHANNVKCMIAIGGWGGFITSGDPFATAQMRTSFVDQIMNYVNTYNLDGVDIDIELAESYVWTNFGAAMSELSSRLHAQGKILTMAVAPWFTGNIANATYNNFDFLNLMTYDYNQSGTGDVAPWSQIYDNVSYFSSRGVSNDRLVIGVPFYGYGSGGAAYTYAQMVGMNPANANVDYANGVYYNGMNTIRDKAEYSKSYGGTMIWEIGQDAYNQYSLLGVIKDVMQTGSQPPVVTTPQQQQPTSNNNQSGVAEWNAATQYQGGAKVSYNGSIYEAQWWTQGETPGSAAVWKLVSGGGEIPSQNPGTNGPEEVFGQKISCVYDGMINVVWGASNNGQTYNVYLDGNIAVDANGASLKNVGCASYNIPASAGTHTIKITSVLNGQESAGVTGNVTVTGSGAIETTTVSQGTSGFVAAGANWTDLPYWSVYFASGWGGDPTGEYKDGGSYNDFTVKINKASEGEWGVQMKTQPITVTQGKEYVCKVTATSNMSSSNQIRFKDEGSQTEKFYTLNSGNNEFEVRFTASSTAQIFFDLGLAPAGLEFKITSFSLSEVVSEPPTEEPSKPVDTNASVEINGYQISTSAEGYRVVYSVSDIDSEVKSVGMIYGLASHASKSDMVVNSSNNTIYTYQATEAGKLAKVYSSKEASTSYAMTMLFLDTVEFYNSEIYVRAYAELEDGTYIYSDVVDFSVYELADYIYKNVLSVTYNSHVYLYENILKFVNPAYQTVKFNFNNILVGVK